MHKPLWTETADRPDYPPLDRDTACDVCVVGAGIAGMSIAYRLAREGKSVVVVDKGQLASGETHHTSAHLASAQDDRFFTIEDEHGREGARDAAASHAAAIDWIEQVAREEGIDCDFRRVPGYLFLGPDDDPVTLDRELEASRRVGLACERLDRAPLPGFDTGPCLRYPDQARFHPLRFVAGLARSLEGKGGRIFGGTRVVDIENTRSPGPRVVRTAGRDAADGPGDAGPTITADHVVLATNSPAGHYLTTMKMVPYRTFIVTLRLTADMDDGLYWDTADPYHYVRLSQDAGGPLLIVGGGDYQTGTEDAAEARQRELESWARERFPVGEVVYRWSGQVLEPADAMAFIGEAQTQSRVWIVTGDSGQGLTHGVIGALLIGDGILGRDNPWAGLYEPRRISPSAAPEYASDALKIGSRFVDWLKPGEVASEDEVPRGHGAIMRGGPGDGPGRGLKPVAVFRDDDGTVHRRSAVCTHLGCIVHWNSAMRSWDCPCHGSRFSPDGQVVTGPAIRELGPVDD